MQDKHLHFTFVSLSLSQVKSQTRARDLSSALRESFCRPTAGRWLARFHRPDRASSGVELLASALRRRAGTGDERRAPWIPYATSPLDPPVLLLFRKKNRFDFPYLCSSVTASILARFDLVLRRQCASVEGRGRRRSSLLRPLRLPRSLPQPRPVLPGKSPLPSPMHVYWNPNCSRDTCLLYSGISSLELLLVRCI